MSDSTRADANVWRLDALAAAVAAVLLLAGAAAAGVATGILAILSGIFIAGFGLYFAAPRRNRAGTLRAEPQVQPVLPDAAREVLECLDDPLLLLDAGGRVIFANRSSAAFVGAGPERKHISAVLRTPELLEAVERILDGADAETIAFSIPVPVQRHYEASVGRTGSGDRRSAPILVQVRDLTATRRAEELRADFVANASHELRTPLAAVSGFIDTLRGHAKNDPDAREKFLEIMNQEARRMRRLIDDLLSLTRIELNEHNPPAGVLDVVSVVRDASLVLSPIAQADGIAVSIGPAQPHLVIGDKDELTQVFQNLIHNAIKYGRDKGEVRVRFGRAATGSKRGGAGQVFVAIEDEGEGIPREAIPRLTERFYRVDVKRSRERGGTGLGLAIVKHILNRHHGRLQVESTPGAGSTFTVFLPAAAADSAAS